MRMAYLFSAGALLILLFAAGAAYRVYTQQPAQQRLFFEQANCDLGERIEGDAADGDLVLRSRSSEGMEVVVESSCGCLVLTEYGPTAKPKVFVPANQSVALKFRIDSKNRSGRQYAYVSSNSSGTDLEPAIAMIEWTVIPATKTFPAIVMLGGLRGGEMREEKVLLVQAPSVPRFAVDRTDVSSPERVSVQAMSVTDSESRYAPGLERRAEVAVRYTAPEVVLQNELIEEEIVIHAQSTSLSAVRIPVRGRLLADVEFSPNKAIVVGTTPGMQQSSRVAYRLGGALQGKPLELVETPPDINVQMGHNTNDSSSEFELVCTIPQGPPLRREIRFRVGERTVTYHVILATRK